MELDEKGIPKVEGFYWFKGRIKSPWGQDPSRPDVIQEVSEPYEIRISRNEIEVFVMGWDIPNYSAIHYEGTWVKFDEKTFFPG